MMTAMSESEESPSLWGMGVVAIAIFVRLLHSLAQKELSIMVTDAFPATSPAIPVLFLTALQVGAALGVFRVTGLSLATSTTNREAAILGGASYAGGLFLSNLLLWSDETAATACYGVQEPVLCMLLLLVAARIPTDNTRAGAVVCVCVGAAFLTARFTLGGGVHALLLLLASLSMLVRNMVVKHLYDSSVGFALRGQNTLLALAAGGTAGAVLIAVVFLSGDLVVAVLMLVVCGVLCVTLLHLLLTLLSLYDTLTVAVFMLWSQVLENVVLVGAAFRPSLLCVLLGAALFAAGHYVYFRDGLDAGTVHLNIKQVGASELLTRLQMVLYSGMILGLLAALLQPYLHHGSVLSFVGLD
ncbi:hypothetical protein ACOMHN_037988 [Nucella lapillus]